MNIFILLNLIEIRMKTYFIICATKENWKRRQQETKSSKYHISTIERLASQTKYQQQHKYIGSCLYCTAQCVVEVQISTQVINIEADAIIC